MAYEDLKPGEGKVLEDEHTALYRDEQGRVHAMSSICTHDECGVKWNAEDTTWDCPCHGSRFTADGHVINGPTVEPLPTVRVPD